ncbi:hypothetical protein ACFLQI_00905 [Candidatus Undinarchaeota archaeon]
MKVGQICIKTRGHDAGGECVVLEVKEKEQRALVTGPKAVTGVRRREVSLAHLKTTSKVLTIRPNATDKDIALLLGRKIIEKPEKSQTESKPSRLKKAEKPALKKKEKKAEKKAGKAAKKKPDKTKAKKK